MSQSAVESKEIAEINALGKKALDAANLSREKASEGVSAALECGRRLAQIKREIRGHDWMTWCESHLQFAASVASRFVKVAHDVEQMEFDLGPGAALRIGMMGLEIVPAKERKQVPGDVALSALPSWLGVVNRWQAWKRKTGVFADLEKLPEDSRNEMRRDLRPLFDDLRRLFADGNERPSPKKSF